ncbi:MoaD/ThiS family protein [Simiduia curdlanivorans]|uniref:MoaD/ThiS family protein n=1 Tax=Simiduia curdlanivorans TaxID=1492769 RepID=A0ABV8V6A8_9GAMM|nr:MoaD/ThiS family protein [Simiduia curdlanivorans]MDN3638794.1 MoaD/ThiS family protein [Simiduia curdlanivorans]
MASLEVTRHLYRFFPQLENAQLSLPAGSVAEVLAAVERQVPGFCDYVLDEQGRLRRHVNLCVNNNLLIDRNGLSDRVGEKDTLFVFQALSGG